MTDAATTTETRDIVVDEVLPHKPEVIWRALTTGDLIGRWLMQPAGFEARVGARFTFQTTPAGSWDGVIQCEVLEVKPNARLAHSWIGGDGANVGYGSRLETVVTWTLSAVEGGARLRLVHSGFHAPGNDSAFKGMSEGWTQVFRKIDAVAGEA